MIPRRARCVWDLRFVSIANSQFEKRKSPQLYQGEHKRLTLERRLFVLAVSRPKFAFKTLILTLAMFSNFDLR